MKNIIKNIILIVALSAVILMVIGVLIYDYIPSANTVAEPNTYETDSTTTKVIAEINDNSSSLTGTTTSTDSSSSTSGTASVVLKSYSITETDLAIYSASNSYNKGKSDPFAAYTETTEGEGTSGETTNSSSGETTNSTNSSTSGNTTNSSSSSDGTLFNSTSSK